MALIFGSTGSEVGAVQFALNTSFNPPTPLKVDGVFGPKTLSTVQDYQANRGLKPDCIVGPQTMDSLFQVVTMTARVKMRTKSGAALVRAPRATFGGLPNRPPPPVWESPWMTEMRQAHEAFLKWMAQPAPKPPLPAPPLAPPPINFPLGFMFGPPPLGTTQVVMAGPPAPRSSAQLPAPVSGADYAVQVGAESSFDILKGKHKESEFKLVIDWGRITGNKLAEVGAETALIVNNEGEVSTEVELSVTGKGLKTALGNDVLSLKLVPILTSAISSQLTASAFLGAKALARIQLVRNRLFIELGGKFGTKGMLERGETDAGRPYYYYKHIPLAGSGEISVGVEF